ncbi:LytTR family DNA-binding domain-containing protein [Lewinella sp. JB7]|uniref:LytR/AlgR family response regulator transcription factor n=1 Tax=Lewinella sp. JB7 TaxID=2962887 RepID=UPI0020C9DEAE|nr:response regulator [Lewinella sp. JB7]MCP9235888.1 response regulator [Lewinella sp. JB7]
MLRKVLVIDDEPPARSLLLEYLSDYAELIVVGEAANGVDALRLIGEHQPEIIFLDIQMPGLTGLEVLARLEELPMIIFTTAYDQYALDAFELHAVDYLLKPYSRARFARAVDRIAARSTLPQANVARLAQQLRDDSTRFPDRIMVPRGGKYVALPVAEILCIRADGDYSTIVTRERSFLSQYSLKETEGRLDPTQFLRIHRSAIVNRDAIVEIYREGHGYDLVLQNGELLRASRSYADVVRDLLF